MYEEIGLEVLLEPFTADEEPGCTACMRGSAEKYKTIYTRPKVKVVQGSEGDTRVEV